MIKEDFAPQKKAGVQAEILRLGLVTRIKAYADIHAHALFSSLGRLIRTPASLVLTILVLSISISIAGSFYLMVKNIRQLTDNLESTNQLSVYLKMDLSEGRISRLVENVTKDAAVESVKLITPEQALYEFKEHSGFGDAINILDKNPLPPVLVVLPKNSLQDHQSVAQLQATIEKFPEVDSVKLDMQWMQRLQSIVALADKVVLLLSILFGLAVLLITGNTIRLELQGRKDEVIIAKLVGATHAFIRRPFLYTGFWLGFTAGVGAWFIVSIVLLSLYSSVQKISQLYSENFNIVFLDYSESFLLLFISSMLGVIGAWSVLNKQLQRLQPE
jgi:cell division transport system permease protein